MKALIYFILFYASIFLISMIPADEIAEETVENNARPKSEQVEKSKTSYTEFSDSIKMKLKK